MERPPPTDPPPGPRASPAIDVAAMSRAYALAWVRMAGARAASTGYRLFWVREGTVGWKDLPVGGAYVIAGSHERCDVVIPEPGIALRHLLATTVELADGPALRLLDLHTATPFFLQSDTPERSIVASGPIVVRLGSTVLGAVPVEEGRSPEPPPPVAPPLPAVVVTSSRSVPVSVRPAAERAPESDGPPSSVSSMPPPYEVGGIPWRPPVPTSVPAPLPAPLPAAVSVPSPLAASSRSWAVTLQREGQAAGVELKDGDLGLGVLIGRAQQCHDGGLQAVLDACISRGHLLLLHHHDCYEAYDLCSTQGTWEEEQPVRRRRLGEEETRLVLAKVRPVLFRWHGQR